MMQCVSHRLTDSGQICYDFESLRFYAWYFDDDREFDVAWSVVCTYFREKYFKGIVFMMAIEGVNCAASSQPSRHHFRLYYHPQSATATSWATTKQRLLRLLGESQL